METWIAADPDGMRAYYKQGFKKNALPVQPNLEEATKADIGAALERATKDTQKGSYHKVRHAPSPLALIDPAVMRPRCPHCDSAFHVPEERGVVGGGEPHLTI